MKLNLLFIAAATSIAAPGAHAAINLGSYIHSNSYNLPSQVSEASAVAYNRDSNSLFVIGDEGGAVVEISKTGQFISRMTFSGQYTGVPSNTEPDTEGIAYLGNGKFAYAEERLQRAYEFTYTAGGNINRSTLSGFSFSTTVGNIGLEGITYDPLTDSLWGVKEKQLRAIYQMTNITGSGSSVVTTNPFPLTNINLVDFSDIYSVAGSIAFAGGTDQENFLLLSQESNSLIEIDRAGNVLSSISLAFLGRNTIEGVTMDDEGNIYLTAEEDGAGTTSVLYVFSRVPEPSTSLLGMIGLMAMIARRKV